jgi:hypothetical protein
MNRESITLVTVIGPAFEELGQSLVPRLELVVRYTRGGVSAINGITYTRGYEICVCHNRRSLDGFKSIIIDGKGDPSETILPSERFIEKTLHRIACEVRNGKHSEIVSRLYCRAKANRPEHVWPERIWLIQDPENDYNRQDGLFST